MHARLPTGAAFWARTGMVVMAVAPFLAYRLMRDTAPIWLMGALAGCQAGAICAMACARQSGRTRILLACLVFATTLAGIDAAGLSAPEIAFAAGGLCHAIAYLGLLAWFGASLLPGREPAVTGLARRVRRTMPDRVTRYTRHVTFAWCGFFLAQLVASAVLLATTSEAVWSIFTGWLNAPLIAAMVLAEYAVRCVLFRHEPRTTLLGTIAAMRQSTGISGHRP